MSKEIETKKQKSKKTKNKGTANSMVIIIVALILLFLLLIGPILEFVIVGAAVKKYADAACKWQDVFKIILSRKNEETLATVCNLLGGGGGNLGGLSGSGFYCEIGGSSADFIEKRKANIINNGDNVNDYIQWMIQASNQNLGGNFPLLASFINHESSFDKYAISATGPAGLGQFAKDTAIAQPAFKGGKFYNFFEELKNRGVKDSSDSNLTDNDIEYIKKNFKDDVRFDPQKSFYAAAGYFAQAINDTKTICSGKTDAELYKCAYLYGYNRSCKNDADQSAGCVYARSAAEKIGKDYEELTGSQNSEKCDVVKFAINVALDVALNDGDPTDQDMSKKKSKYSKDPSQRSYGSGDHCNVQGQFPWYADCASFVGYVVRNTIDPDFPPNGTALQYNYVKDHLDKYDMIPINRASDLLPGDILSKGSCSSINNCSYKDGHTFIFVGKNQYDSDVIVSASQCSYAPMFRGQWTESSEMGMAYRLKK